MGIKQIGNLIENFGLYNVLINSTVSVIKLVSGNLRNLKHAAYFEIHVSLEIEKKKKERNVPDERFREKTEY